MIILLTPFDKDSSIAIRYGASHVENLSSEVVYLSGERMRHAFSGVKALSGRRRFKLLLAVLTTPLGFTGLLLLFTPSSERSLGMALLLLILSLPIMGGFTFLFVAGDLIAEEAKEKRLAEAEAKRVPAPRVSHDMTPRPEAFESKGGPTSQEVQQIDAGLESPLAATDEDEYIRRCLAVEFRDEAEDRTFRSATAFADVLTPLNSQRYSTAITAAKGLLPRYEDFDLVYKWLAMAYRATQQLEQSQQILLEGIAKSKRKGLLLTDLGETEWQRGKVEDGLYWLAQALHCMAINPIEYNVYLLIGYLAKGVTLVEEANLFFERVDKMRAGQVRLTAAHTDQLMHLCRQGRMEPMRRVIRELADKYLKSA